jgi:acetyltransferase
MLQMCGLSLVASRLTTSGTEAARVAAEFGFPVVAKIESPDIPHKTEANGVRLNLTSEAQVKKVFAEIVAASKAYKSDARISGVVIQPMEPTTTELVLGLRHDPVFGTVIMVGLGGIFIEALNDVVFASAPISKTDAVYMIERLRCQSVLGGIRGKAGVDVEALADALCRLSQLAQSHPEVVELDLNPVFGSDDRIVAVDWLMVREANG